VHLRKLMARLLWEYEGQVIRDYPFRKGSITIGRRKDSTIIFSNPEVSSLHARIDKIGPDYILTDLQSTNGTFVNGLKVLSHRLSHGERISIGKNVLLFIGTEKAQIEAERASIPLDQTVIIGPTTRRKSVSPSREKMEAHYIEPSPSRNYSRICAVAFLVVGALVVLGVFAVKNKASFLGGPLPKAHQAERSAGTAVAPSAERETISQPGNVSLPATSETPKKPPVNEKNPESGGRERPSVNIEAIVWSSNPEKSFVLINGVEFRVGDSVEGEKIARIERDRIVLQSQEGESVVRLKLK
jgi:pSer/pThr/pTyr-binding forkhead associated (FHA) protein